jgi:proline racemase/trans-L-3-hydroxyproline dehydratase
MAAMYGKGELMPGDEIVFESTISTLMKGKIAEKVQVGKYKAIIPDVMATAYITAFNQIVIDPEDPLRKGFLF